MLIIRLVQANLGVEERRLGKCSCVDNAVKILVCFNILGWQKLIQILIIKAEKRLSFEEALFHECTFIYTESYRIVNV